MSRYAQVVVVEWEEWKAWAADFRRALFAPDLEAMRVLAGSGGVPTEVAMEEPVQLVDVTPGWFGRLLGHTPGKDWDPEPRVLFEQALGVIAQGGAELPCRTGGVERASLLADAMRAAGHVDAAEAFRAATGSMGHEAFKDIAEGITPLRPEVSQQLAVALASVQAHDDWRDTWDAAEEACRGLQPSQGLVFLLEV